MVVAAITNPAHQHQFTKKKTVHHQKSTTIHKKQSQSHHPNPLNPKLKNPNQKLKESYNNSTASW